MTRRTRRARAPLTLGLAALALLSACAFAPRPCAAQTPANASAHEGTPLRKEWLLYPLRARQHDEAALVRLVERRGVSFMLTDADEKEMRAAGATDRLIGAVLRNYVAPPKTAGMGVGMGRGIGPGDTSGGGGPVESDYTRPFRQNEVTRRAVITSRPDPGYTEEARKNHVEGLLRLRVVLNLSGEVTNISVVKGLPDGLTEKAIEAARRIKFTPAEKDGRVVSQYAVIEYIFSFPINESDVDERAVILEKPEAEYTEEARRAGLRGRVVLKVTLAHFGRVVLDSVEAGLPHGLTEKALEAAARIVFEPARLGRRQVSQRATVEYVFNP